MYLSKKISSIRKPGVKEYPKYIKRMFARKVKLWRKWTISRNIVNIIMTAMPINVNMLLTPIMQNVN
jgi:hypothetical protein